MHAQLGTPIMLSYFKLLNPYRTMTLLYSVFTTYKLQVCILWKLTSTFLTLLSVAGTFGFFCSIKLTITAPFNTNCLFLHPTCCSTSITSLRQGFCHAPSILVWIHLFLAPAMSGTTSLALPPHPTMTPSRSASTTVHAPSLCDALESWEYRNK